jgi:HK97 family phage portal protein
MNLRNIFKKAAPVQAVENLLNAILYQWTGDLAYLPPEKIESYIKEGYKGNTHVYSVVTAITQRCTGIPFKHYEGDKEIANSEVIKLLNQPNPEQSGGEFIEASSSWLLLTGNLYWYRLAPDVGLNKGKPYEMYCLPAHLVRIKGGGPTQPVTGYELEIGAGQWLTIPASEVMHLKYFNPDTGTNGEQLYGQSPLQAGNVTISASNSGYKALNKGYQAGMPAGILTGQKDTGNEFTKDQGIAIQEAWDKKIRDKDGTMSNYMKVIIARNPMQWVKMGYSIVDMNIIESMRYTLQDICNLYHAPLPLFSLEASTLDNYKEARKAIYTDCVIPFFDRLIPKLNSWLMPAYGGTLDFNIDVIPELTQDKGVQAQSLSTAWWLTPNERRGQMGLLPHPDPTMDTILFPQGLVPGVDLGMDNEDMSL